MRDTFIILLYTRNLYCINNIKSTKYKFENNLHLLNTSVYVFCDDFVGEEPLIVILKCNGKILYFNIMVKYILIINVYLKIRI